MGKGTGKNTAATTATAAGSGGRERAAPEGGAQTATERRDALYAEAANQRSIGFGAVDEANTRAENLGSRNMFDSPHGEAFTQVLRDISPDVVAHQKAIPGASIRGVHRMNSSTVRVRHDDQSRAVMKSRKSAVHKRLRGAGFAMTRGVDSSERTIYTHKRSGLKATVERLPNELSITLTHRGK